MSTEIARKIQKRVPKKKKTPRLSVDLINERYTGEEPVWDGWESWPVGKFFAEHDRALNYYNYHSNSSELKPFVIEWMEANNYGPEHVKAVKAAPDYYPGSTAGALCRCLLRGMPPLHPQAQEYWDQMPGRDGVPVSDLLFVHDAIGKAVEMGNIAILSARQTQDITHDLKSPVISPTERLRKKVTTTLIAELDTLLDSWNMPRSVEDPLPTLDLFERIRHHEIPPMGLSTVGEWIGRHLLEMQQAQSGEDEYLVESYSFLTKKRLQERIDIMTKLLDDVNRAKHSAKAQRAPRAKKLPSASKQIEKLKYLKDSTEFKITSVNPIRIVGAYRVLAFNTKYRTMIDYVAQSEQGIQIKGTTLKNLDEAACKQIKLRKPDEVLPTVLNGTPRQIENAWNKLTTKAGKPNGRINEEIIFVRVFETKP